MDGSVCGGAEEGAGGVSGVVSFFSSIFLVLAGGWGVRMMIGGGANVWGVCCSVFFPVRVVRVMGCD